MLKESSTPKRRTALGQGLDALIPIDGPRETDVAGHNVKYLPIETLFPNPYQPRRVFDESALSDLANSIKEMGVIQPLVARRTPSGDFQIVAGERRWKAAMMAGFSTIPVIVRDLSDAESLEIALIENLQREDLNPLDTAEAYDVLIKKFSYTHEALAKRIGKDRSSITNLLRLLKLPDPIKEDLRGERLSMGHARTLLAIDHLPTQLNLSRKVLKRNLSVRDLEKIVQNFKDKQLENRSETRVQDPVFASLARNLSSHLSTKVTIKNFNDDSGKLEISFHSREELGRLLETIGYSEDFA
jgi:ParB family transcriptional regulator, chromosome partitioning protein